MSRPERIKDNVISFQAITGGLSEKAKNISARTYVMIGAFIAGSLILNHTLNKPQQNVRVFSNPTDSRNIPGYNSNDTNQEHKSELAKNDLNVAGLIREEKQLVTIAIAQQFIGAAHKYTAQEGHKCFGMTPLNCLNTFDANREVELQATALGTTGAPVVVNQGFLSSILSKSVALQKLEGLRIAKIMIKTPESRRGSEQQILDIEYPALSQGKAASQLQPRPALLLNEIKKTRTLNNASSDIEEQAKVKLCMQLTDEERNLIGECN